jgi:hypothetical protein
MNKYMQMHELIAARGSKMTACSSVSKSKLIMILHHLHVFVLETRLLESKWKDKPSPKNAAQYKKTTLAFLLRLNTEESFVLVFRVLF